MFSGRTLLIVTKHGKEEIFLPLFKDSLGVECILASSFDTDKLGTFTGEVERQGDALATIRRKCHEALALYGCDMAIASEGSFGPHPAFAFGAADDELVMFIDTLNQLEIIARELSMDTNFNGSKIETEGQLEEFLSQVGFPKHAVIIRSQEGSASGIIKGINDHERVRTIAQDYLTAFGSFYIETDMRAMNNPKRMMVIEKAAQKLLDKIKSLCPECQTPGYGITDAKQGLTCILCGNATSSTLSYVYSCAKCDFQDEVLYPRGKKQEDPMYCNFCNP
jgi:hypothetical protein